MQAASDLVDRFVAYIIDPAILLIFSFGFLVFIWGLVKFLWNLQGGEIDTGKQHMLWGIVGMVTMVSVWGIIAIIDNTFDLDISDPDISRLDDVTAPADFIGR